MSEQSDDVPKNVQIYSSYIQSVYKSLSLGVFCLEGTGDVLAEEVIIKYAGS
jgi:hypothetical protein